MSAFDDLRKSRNKEALQAKVQRAIRKNKLKGAMIECGAGMMIGVCVLSIGYIVLALTKWSLG